MKIAVITPHLDLGKGGAEETAHHITSALAENYEVTHFIHVKRSDNLLEERFGIPNPDEYETEIIEKPFYYDFMKNSNRLMRAFMVNRSRIFFKMYWKIRDKYDKVFFTNEVLDHSQYYSSQEEFRSTNEDVIMYHHHPTFDCEMIMERSLYVRMFNGLGEVKNLDADKNVFNSRYSCDMPDGEIIHPPVEEDFEFNQTEENVGVIVGRITPGKKFEEAVRICDKSRNIEKLHIIGFVEEKSYLREIKDLANSADISVEFHTGPDPKSQSGSNRRTIKKILRESKIGFSCRKETFGIVTAEYMKSGVIPFVKDKGANRELVEKKFLRYSRVEEGASKLDTLIEEREDEAYDYIKDEKARFGREKFRKEIKSLID
ncbi:MAG: glycosyltransferase [Candidatus Nanohaloarchaea archaeon]